MSQVEMDFSSQARDAGMQRAEDHANQVHESWSEKALSYFIEFVNSRKAGERFVIEDLRRDANTVVPVPPSERSWGAVTMKAVKMKIIKKVGYTQVKNIKAHKANVAVWVKNI